MLKPNLNRYTMKKIMLVFTIMLATIFATAQNKTTSKNAQTKESIGIEDLQKSITKYIAKNCDGYTTDEAYKITTKDVISYEVVVEKAPNKVDLYFDKDGKFTNKVIEKKPPTTKTKTLPKTKTTNTIKTDTIKSDTLKK
jgi:hypothetical protein